MTVLAAQATALPCTVHEYTDMLRVLKAFDRWLVGSMHYRAASAARCPYDQMVVFVRQWNQVCPSSNNMFALTQY